jgi:serine/threonine protein phosphatase PrpC
MENTVFCRQLFADAKIHPVIEDTPVPIRQSLSFQVSSATDIGGGRENQDSHFIHFDEKENILILCILDGHGIDYGKFVSVRASEFLKAYFINEMESLKTAPYDTIVRAHVLANQHLKEAIKEDLTKKEFLVKEEEDGGYLTKRYSRSNAISAAWTNVNGGTTCTIIAILNNKIYSSNLGDSAATIISRKPLFKKEVNLQYLGDSAAGEAGQKPSLSSSSSTSSHTANDRTPFMQLTTDHSPENIGEYHRIMNSTRGAFVRFVYDRPTQYKHLCNPIYGMDDSGKTIITNHGYYCKNVREEWGSLITTTDDAKFPVSLSMTRSFGDFYMQSLGVSYLPEVQCIDLDTIYCAEGVDPSEPLHLLVASDGVWDCWKYEEITKKVIEASETTDPAGKLIDDNKELANTLFGNQSDNATAIIVTIKYEQKE